MKKLLLLLAIASSAHIHTMAQIFSDSFETGDFSSNVMQDGTSFKWNRTGVSISDSISKSGNYSAKFVFGPNADGDDSFKELGFRFGTPVSEIWVEYWILYPENYFHRSQSGPSNNKFFQLNYNGAPKQMLTVESYGQQGSGNSAMRRFLSTTQNPDRSNNWPTSDKPTMNFIGNTADFAIELEQWTKILIHYKAGSDGINNDGRAEIYINNQLFHALDWPFWEPDNQGKINGGYILGWSNSGFDSATYIFIDDFTLSTTSLIDSTTTGIQKTAEMGTIKVYPNPATDHVTISGLPSKEQTTVILSNALGQQVGEVMNFTDKASVQVNTTHLSEGVYLLTILTNNQRFTTKIIK